MNYIRHLNAFFTRIRNDNRLTTAHVSLYLAAFHYWNLRHFHNPFPVYREEIMHLSKIGSKNTYHKCIKELHQANYFIYFPAASRYQPAQISMIRMDKNKPDPMANQPDLFSPISGTHTVPNLSRTCPNIETHTVPKMGHLIKHINVKHKTVCKTPTEILTPNVNGVNLNIPADSRNRQPEGRLLQFAAKGGFNKNQKLNENINTLRRVPNPGHIEQAEQKKTDSPKPLIPSLSEIESFFQSKQYSLEEARKFHLYNQAKGWMLTATIPVADWQAIACKWMMNKSAGTKNDISANTSTHHLKTDKNYEEPL